MSINCSFIKILTGGIKLDKKMFEEVAHIDMISYLLGDKDARIAFQDETGVDLGNFTNRSMIDKSIDQATGYEKEVFYKFIVWATETQWSKPEDANSITVYRNAKEYLRKHSS